MRDEQTPDGAAGGPQGGTRTGEPSEARGVPDRDAPHGMEGAPTGAVYGVGPEGTLGDEAGQPHADVLGQVHGDRERDRLVQEAQAEGPPKPDRMFVGSNRDVAPRPAGEGGDGHEATGERDRR